MFSIQFTPIIYKSSYNISYRDLGFLKNAQKSPDYYSETSQDGHPSGNAKLAVLQRWPSYGTYVYIVFAKLMSKSLKWIQTDTHTLNKEKGVF